MYTNLASAYDRFMDEEYFSELVWYLQQLFEHFGLQPKLVLDLGCGTGEVCSALSKQGMDMIGVDISSDMLQIAADKARNRGYGDILFLNQDMRDFELYGTVDAVLSLTDSLNHILDAEELCHVFSLVHNYLNPGGLFIFDINTEYKFRKVLDGRTFSEEDEDVTYVWNNFYDKKSRICQFDLTFFIREEDGKYRKCIEQNFERAYKVDEIRRYLADAQLEVLAVFDEMSFSNPTNRSERVFFVCKYLK